MSRLGPTAQASSVPAGRLVRVLRVTAVSLAVGLVLADSSIAVLALPAIYRDYGVKLGALHWVLTSFNLSLALGAIPAALLTRRVGTARVFTHGLVLFAIASTGCSLAPSFPTLVGFRSVQALGGAAVVVAALELLYALLPSNRRGVAVWVGAGVAGAALGPAVGGVLTETISWQAVFGVQMPLALLPLALLRRRFLTSLERPAALTVKAVRPRVAPNVALAFLSAGLAAALFLVVLLLIEGWRLSPIGAAAVMSVLPLAAIASGPVARRTQSWRAGAAAGALLVAGGLAALALLPRAGWAWAVPPQILVGAGLALALAALTETAVPAGDPRALHGAVTIAARHAGVVLGLLVLTPVLVGDLGRQRTAAEQAGTARLLDSPIAQGTKIELARGVSERLEGTRGRIPDFGPAFRSVDASPQERPALARLERSLQEVVDRAVTSSFSTVFLFAAALALVALAPLGLVRRAPA